MGAVHLTLQVWKRKVERNLQDHGLKTTLSKTIAYLFKFAFEHRVYRLYRIDLLKDKTEPPSELEGVEFRFLDASDEAAIGQIEGNSEWLKGTVKQRLAAGAICVAAFEGGQLAGFNLVSFGNVFMPLVQIRRAFREGEAWSEQIATVKNFRKKGLASQLRYRIFEELRRRGYRKLYGGALDDNLPSLKLAQRVGFREFVDVHYTRVLTFNWWRYVRLHR